LERYTANPVFTRELIKWYHQNRRDLPWRNTRDPYKIWLSEIILQQTRVKQGLPYYLKFVKQYQTVADLASAAEKDVLRLWQGLGYYSRARNLHRCAQLVTKEYHGKFPTTYKELIKLPGIGDYTASAIASFAFHQPEPVVDGNVFRVLARIFGIKQDISKPQTRSTFKELSGLHQQSASAADYNQAIMEFGALQCTPKSPLCGQCVMGDFCYANSTSLQSELPQKKSKVKVRDRHIHYYLLRYEDRVLMRQRTSKDIWQGLYDFLSFEPDQDGVKAPPIFEGSLVGEPTSPYRHRLSHQLIHAQFSEVRLSQQQDLENYKTRYDLQEFRLNELHDLPKPILIHKYLKATIF